MAERNTAVRLSFSSGQLCSRPAPATRPRPEEILEASFEGDDLSIAFNPQYLLDGLAAIDSDTARISFTEPGKPALITGKPGPDGAPDYRYLLMPIRLGQASRPGRRSRRRVPDPAGADRLPQLRGGRRAAGAGRDHVHRRRTARARPTWSRRPATRPRSASHRVAADAPLIRRGADRAIIRAAITGAGRDSLVEIEVNPGRANRVRLNRAPVPRPREVLGVLRCVLFAPEDLAIVKGDPDQRRRYLDDLLVATRPRYAGVRSDYERVVRQRIALLKSAPRPGGGGGARAASRSGTTSCRGRRRAAPRAGWSWSGAPARWSPRPTRRVRQPRPMPG